jgi:Prealbumin-like fold domain
MSFFTKRPSAKLGRLTRAAKVHGLARLKPDAGSGRRRVALVITACAAIAGIVVFTIAPAFASGTPFSDSTFNASNGDLTSSSSTLTHDWNPATTSPSYAGPLQAITCPGAPSPTVTGASGTNCGLDESSSSSDNIFTSGAKEDTACPSVTLSKPPPNKDDLVRIYTNQERGSTTGDQYVYLAWERTNLLGSAHMDFEFSQSQASPCSNGVNIPRTLGDFLVAFDFGGSGQPVLSLYTWASSGTCEISGDTPPCWVFTSDLSSSGDAQGEVNSTNVTDKNPPGNPRTLTGSVSSNGTISSTFGEAAVDLSAAGIFTGGCKRFGHVTLKSRSSGSSFNSELKDLIAPVPVSVNNCGSLLIHKTDGSGHGLAGATFTATPGSTSASGTTATSSTLTDEGSGYYCIDNMRLGQSTVVKETVAPPNYNVDPNSQTLTVSSAASCADRLAATNITADGSNFVDQPQVGAIKITKTGKDKNCTSSGTTDASTGLTCAGAGTAYVSAATFQILDGSGHSVGTASTASTGSDGVQCFHDVPIGSSYTVHESSAPTGWDKAPDQTNVAVTGNTTCASSPTAVSMVDKPLTTITVSTTSLAGTGVTNSTVKCVNETTFSSTPHTTSGLDPNTDTGYTCTIKIDP